MKIVINIVKIFSLIFFLFSCTDNNSESKKADSSISNPSDSLFPDLETYINNDNSYVVVLLGYGYNEGRQKDTLLSQLDSQYGLAENGGIIIPFVYPDDFVSFGYERISLLPDNIEDVLLDLNGAVDLNQVSTIITLGAPDSTHYALARLQDLIANVRIFSVFSQDDILGTESGSTIAIDYAISQSKQQSGYETIGEIDLSYPDDVFTIIAPLINAGLNWDSVNEKGLFISALRSEYSKKTNCNFFVFVDSQTGLRSENHYVLTERE